MKSHNQRKIFHQANYHEKKEKVEIKSKKNEKKKVKNSRTHKRCMKLPRNNSLVLVNPRPEKKQMIYSIILGAFLNSNLPCSPETNHTENIVACNAVIDTNTNASISQPASTSALPPTLISSYTHTFIPLTNFPGLIFDTPPPILQLNRTLSQTAQKQKYDHRNKYELLLKNFFFLLELMIK